MTRQYRSSLRFAAVVWLAAFCLPIPVIDMLADRGYLAERWCLVFLGVGITGAVIAVVASLVMRQPPRSLVRRTAVVGLAIWLPSYLFLCMAALGYLVLWSDVQMWVGFSLFVLGSVVWAGYAIKKVRRNIAGRRIFERQFVMREDHIGVVLPIRMDDGATSNNGPMSRLSNWLGPKLAPAIPLAYPLQRFMTENGGLGAVLAFLSILATPLALYIGGRLSAGAYFWLYCVPRYEKQQGKRVLSDSA